MFPFEKRTPNYSVFGVAVCYCFYSVSKCKDCSNNSKRNDSFKINFYRIMNRNGLQSNFKIVGKIFDLQIKI